TVDPCSAGGGAIVLKRFDVWQLLAVRYCVAIDFFKDFFRFRLRVRTFCGVVPGERVESLVARATVFFSFCFQASTQMNHEPEFTAGIAGSLYRLLAELQQALRVGECAVFLGCARRGKQEHLGPDRFWR